MTRGLFNAQAVSFRLPDANATSGPATLRVPGNGEALRVYAARPVALPPPLPENRHERRAAAKLARRARR